MSTGQDTTLTRRAICLVCRTLLPEGARCAHGHRHTVVSLHTEQGRDALRREIWETPYMPLHLPGDEGVVAATAAAPVVVGLVSLNMPVFIATAAVAWSALAGAALWRWRQRRRRNRLAPDSPPRGRPGYLRPPWRVPHWRGVVQATDSITAPLTGRPCLGYSVVLRAREFFGGDVMLIDAWTRGGSVALQDGRTIQLVEGTIEIADPTAVEIGDRAAVARYLDAIEPALSSDARPLLVFDTVTESILPAGSQVQLMGKVVEVPGMYRETGRHWRMRDVPLVHVLLPTPTHPGRAP
ncbi:MAG TPA: hypothetical protein VNM90_01955 [Haliangium sp.]|nr:hypothetical protein [Haliangium sp.]